MLLSVSFVIFTFAPLIRQANIYYMTLPEFLFGPHVELGDSAIFSSRTHIIEAILGSLNIDNDSPDYEKRANSLRVRIFRIINGSAAISDWLYDVIFLRLKELDLEEQDYEDLKGKFLDILEQNKKINELKKNLGTAKGLIDYWLNAKRVFSISIPPFCLESDPLSQYLTDIFVSRLMTSYQNRVDGKKSPVIMAKFYVSTERSAQYLWNNLKNRIKWRFFSESNDQELDHVLKVLNTFALKVYIIDPFFTSIYPTLILSDVFDGASYQGYLIYQKDSQGQHVPKVIEMGSSHVHSWFENVYMNLKSDTKDSLFLTEEFKYDLALN